MPTDLVLEDRESGSKSDMEDFAGSCTSLSEQVSDSDSVEQMGSRALLCRWLVKMALRVYMFNFGFFLCNLESVLVARHR